MWLAWMTLVTLSSWANPPTHRAVLSAVSSYSYDASRLGWAALGPLHTDRDLELMRAALESRGFAGDQVVTLHEERATREQILAAIDRHLVQEAQPGDHLFFFWSGHGQQVADDDPEEELDRLDETLVAWGARRTSLGGYDGSAHLRDDELGQRVLAMRRAVGPQGSVVVALDSCHSGTATRNAGVVRGGAPPLGEVVTPRPARTSDFFEVQEAEQSLAPFVLLSATRSHQLAREVPVGRPTHGAFTGALSEALASEAASTWAGILDLVRAQVMAEVADQVPQLEGNGDLGVFGTPQQDSAPYFRVNGLDGMELELAAGTLHGLTPGSRVEVYPAGAVGPGEGAPLAVGEVREADLVTSVMVLASAPEEPAAVASGRAFVVQTATGDLGLTVTLSPQAADWKQAMGALTQVKVVAGNGEAQLVEEAGELLLVHRAKVVHRLALPVDDTGRAAMLEALQNLAYTKLLTSVRLSDPRFAAAIELRPAVKEGGKCIPSGERFAMDGGEYRIPEGSLLQIVLRPPLERYYHPTVINTDARGMSQQLFPRHAAERLIPKPGEWAVACLMAEVSESEGPQQLTLFVTSAPIDLSPLLPLARPPSRTGLAPIQALLDGLGEHGAGLVPSRAEQSGFTASLVYSVLPVKSD